MRHNWRTGKSIRNSTASDFDKDYLTAYSYSNENLSTAYVSEPKRMLAVDYTGFTYADTVSFIQTVSRIRMRHTIILKTYGLSCQYLHSLHLGTFY
jgi:hypothetical protein